MTHAEQLDEPATHTARRLLYDHWDPTNTHGYDPTLDPETSDDALPLHYGNYNADLPEPQLSLTQPQGENTVDGNRWSGKNMGADRMVQHRRGQILVQCWATSGTIYNGGEPADEIVSTIRKEVENVIGGFAQGPTDGGPNDGIIISFSTSWDGRFPDVNEDRTHPAWQSQVRVTYDWDREH